jgi:hypothetical protein
VPADRWTQAAVLVFNIGLSVADGFEVQWRFSVGDRKFYIAFV